MFEKVISTNQMSDNLLFLENVRRAYSSDAPAVSDINLGIERGAKLAIVGETGSGKSTLLKIAAGLISPDSGKVFYHGEEIEDPKDKLIAGEAGIAYLSQHFELPKFVTVEKHLYDPYEMTLEEAHQVYRACQIDHLLDSDTRHLSGGEKQRVALAKLLLSSPDILLLDEPFSNLDPIHKQIIKEVIQTLGDELSLTIVLVSHEPHDVLPWANNIVVLRHGKIVQQNEPHIIYNQPINEYVAGLFGKYNLVKPRDWGLKTNGQYKTEDGRIIVRPENFKINKGMSSKALVTISDIQYYGSHEEVHILTNKDRIIVKAPVGSFEMGENVALSILL